MWIYLLIWACSNIEALTASGSAAATASLSQAAVFSDCHLDRLDILIYHIGWSTAVTHSTSSLAGR